MSYTYLQEQGEVSSAECFLDIPQSVLLNLINMPKKSSLQDRETEYSPDSQSGVISPHSMVHLGREESILSVAAFHAKTFPPLEKEQGLQVKEVAYGNIWHGLSMKFDQNSCSLRTHLCLWTEDLQLSSVTLPQWGMMQDGVFWEQMIWGVITYAKGVGYWPTPLKSEGSGGSHMKLTDAIALKEGFRPRYYKLDGMEGRVAFTGKVNPNWAEWLMGFPVGWTDDLTELEMHKFQQWQHLHSAFSQVICLNPLDTPPTEG